MSKHKDQRIGVLVDVSNMYHSAKNLYHKHVNFKEVLKTAVAGRQLIRATAYVTKTETEEETPFFEALHQQGFEVKMKDLQIFTGGAKKADWDVG
ncbi:NYN domain-containing protein, partial [bacterium]|nr:NYN domain-containing protein [bacterium]